MRMEVRLSVTNGKANVKQVVLGPETIIGRSQECNLKIASSQVSRRHSRITVSDGQVRVSDLGSANGTFLNGRALPPETEVVVAPGNALTIGPLRFVFHFNPPAPPKVVAPPIPESDTKDAIPLSLLGRPASQLGDEETVDTCGQHSPAKASPLGPAQTSPASADDSDTDFEEGLPDRTLSGLKKEPVVVTPPEGAADTVLDMNLAEEARRKAAREAAASDAAASNDNEIPESHTDSGTALLPPAEVSETSDDAESGEFPDFKAVDETEPDERPASRTRKSTEKKPWGLLGGMFGKSKPKRQISRREEDDDVEEELEGGFEPDPELEEVAPTPAPKARTKPVPVNEEDTLQIGPPISFEEEDETPAPVPAAKAAAPAPVADFDPADFLLGLSKGDETANLDPKTKEPGEKPVLAKPPEKRAAPRLAPEVKSAAKPSPAPQVKSNNPSEKQDGDPSLSDFLKNL